MRRWLELARKLVIVDAPANLGLAPTGPGPEPGTRRAPDALRALGLHDALNADDQMRLDAPAYSAARVHSSGMRNVDSVAEYSRRLADILEPIIRAGDFPLVLGGDCSLLVGSMLATSRIGDAALLFIDGHTDFYLPSQSSTGGIAGIDLALATGWGPDELADIENRGPLVKGDCVAAFANRDFDLLPKADIPSIGEAVALYLPLSELRAIGMTNAVGKAQTAVQHRFWVHFDVDAIDSNLMPAVDSPQPDGLDWQEAEELLAAALATDPTGLQITIYDPARDPQAAHGRNLVELLVRLLGD